MKKYLLFSLLFVIGISSFGQKHSSKKDEFAYAGISLSASNTWLLNKYVFDKGDEQDIAASFGSNIGLVAGYTFNKNIGVEINFIYNAHNMKYSGILDWTTKDYEYDSETKLKFIDIPILFKAGTETYFEIGPQFSFLSKAEYKISCDTTISFSTTTTTFNSNSTKNVKSKFSGSSFNLVFGFGHYFEIDKQLSINAGFRLMYGLSDIKGVDALGFAKSDYSSSTKGIGDFKTNMAAMYLHIGAIYKIQ